MLAAVGLSLCYAGSLFAILPVLELLVSTEGPRLNLSQELAGRRLGAIVEVYDAAKHEGGFTDGWFIVRNLDDDSPLRALDIHIGDGLRLNPSLEPKDEDNQVMVDEALLRHFATPPTGHKVTVIAARPTEGDRPDPRFGLEVVLLPASISDQVLAKVTTYLPRDQTPEGRIALLIRLLLFIFIVNVIGNVCRFISEYLVTISAARAMMDLRRNLFKRAVGMHMSWYGSHLTDTMSRVVRDSQDVRRGYAALFGKIAREPLKAVLVFGVALYVDARMTMILVIGVPIAGFFLQYVSKKISKANKRLLKGFSVMLGMLNASLSGMRVVRAYTREGYERKRQWRLERQMFRQQKKIAKVEALTSPTIEVLAVALAMLGIVWLAQRTLSGELKSGEFIQMVILLGAMFDPVRQVSGTLPRLFKANSAAERVFEFIDLPIEQRSGADLPKLDPITQSIEFRNVKFSYPDTTKPALNDVSFKIDAGQTVAIVGPNGSGKTTIVSLLLRFFEPESGQILVDGHDVAKVSIKSLRGQVSLVTQDAVVFAMTARENIAYGRLEGTEEELLNAAKRAHADEFISRLPEKYDTVLGEFGQTLSGGERQRMSLARAILRDAPIFVFDEATSQVDVDSEKKIREAMIDFMRGRTSIVIAHRIATIQHADQIVVLDGGQVVDIGKHDDLIGRCELYKTLFYTHLHGHNDGHDEPG
jgi:ABC-type multidrug transport system fused ATPase/permease subunit